MIPSQPAHERNDHFWIQGKLRTLGLLFQLKAILKPKEKITLNDLERLLMDEPFYLTAYQQAHQYITARYEAEELDRAEFQTQLTNLNKRCDVWINEPPATKDTIKMAIKGIFDAFGRIFH